MRYLVLLLALAGCSCAAATPYEGAFEIPLEYHEGDRLVIERIQPMSGWREAFEEVRRCAGHRADPTRRFEDIHWWRVSTPIETRTQIWYGQFDGVKGILLSPRAIADIQLVKHEMLHYLMPLEDHPRDVFAVACDLDPFGQSS